MNILNIENIKTDNPNIKNNTIKPVIKYTTLLLVLSTICCLTPSQASTNSRSGTQTPAQVSMTDKSKTTKTTEIAKAKKKQNANKVMHVCNKSNNSHEILSCAIYFEARGEKTLGMASVGHVILNRKEKNAKLPSIKSVVYQKNQFTYTTRKNLIVLSKDQTTWQQAQNIAKTLILLDKFGVRSYVDPTDGATYYHTKDVRPKWRHAFDVTLVHKNHIFYKE